MTVAMPILRTCPLAATPCVNWRTRAMCATHRKKTVYVKSGETTEVEWENTPITGQIQITKRSADYNPPTACRPGHCWRERF